MHGFTAPQARRPRIIYGRNKLHRPRSIASTGSDEHTSDQSESGSDAEAVESILAKENVHPRAAVKGTFSSAKGKGRADSASPAPVRLAMRQKQSNVVDLCSDTDDDDSEIGNNAIRSPHRRPRVKGKSHRRTLIDERSDSESAEHNATGSNVDIDSLTERIQGGLRFSEGGEKEEDNGTLAELLQTCHQDCTSDFESSLNSIEDKVGGSSWYKVGEATFSEVFAIEGSDIVVKIIPLALGVLERGGEYPERSSLIDVEREVRITEALHDVDDAFVRLHRACVVRGSYPERLLRAWDERRRVKEDQNRRPDILPYDQTYCILVLANGGSDLETLKLKNWQQALGIFVQVCRALAKAELAYKFEHRDLHWGNIVVRPCQAASDRSRIERIADPRQSGVRATIIDFTLSRALLPGSNIVSAHPFDDPAFFQGSGEIQFDVYRDMRIATRSDWSGHHPYTNVLWLRYLSAKLVDDKHLVLPEDNGHVEADCYNLLRKLRASMDEELSKTSKARKMVSAQTLYKAITSQLRSLKGRSLQG
jgi:serine/threonine-protein kinase haspin